MNYLEASFNAGLDDGIDGTLIEDVRLESSCKNETIRLALHEYRAGIILGTVIKEYEVVTLLEERWSIL